MPPTFLLVGLFCGHCILSAAAAAGGRATAYADQAVPSATPASSCLPLLLPKNTSVAPFSPAEVALMQGFFLKNIDIGGDGGVAASPDKDVSPSVGSYFYHWQRDGALSMRVVLEELLPSLGRAAVNDYMARYARWVLRVQSLKDPFGIDILAEPKFVLPEGGVYPKGWCRPQSDGPALRATTLMLWADSLVKSGQNSSLIAELLWSASGDAGAVKVDLDWLVQSWRMNTCDLWEDIQSDDFFWNRMVFRRALAHGAAFAKARGDQTRVQRYSAAAAEVQATLMSHWNGVYLEESTNRKMDGAVIVALNDGQAAGEAPVFPLSSKYAAGTVHTLSELFCTTFPINNEDTRNGVPGRLFGRYAGDTYQGGNPWILITASLAELFYRAAHLAKTEPARLSHGDIEAWYSFLPREIHRDRKKSSRSDILAQQLVASGDACLLRIKHHVAGAGYHLSEQLNKDSGFEWSATDLSWSYGTVLKALRFREISVGN